MKHEYTIELEWTGNTGHGTNSYTGYQRSHQVIIKNKPVIECSSDPAFRGDPSRHNPEELLVASLSSCHMLWYLHLCADNGIVVVKYCDKAGGTMIDNVDGGKFIEVVLQPEVTISDPSRIEQANSLHEQAHKKCFIANSCNFPIRHKAVCRVVS